MLIWILALGVAGGLSWFLYRNDRRTRGMSVAQALRFVGIALAAALAGDAPGGLARVRPPVVALDASASWRRGRPDSAWRSALSRARAAARGDTVWLIGDSVRALRDDSLPGDAASRVEGAVDRALGAGRPLTLISDGEVDDPRALGRLLSGSQLDIAPAGAGRDAAVLALELPRSAVAGDSARVLVRVASGPQGAAAGTVSISLDKTLLARIPLDSMPAWTERDITTNIRVPEGAEHRLIRALVSTPGDAVAVNDSLGAVLDVASAPRAVFVSTGPDQDSRFSLEVLRGTLAIAVRAFYRVAPGVWRQEPGMTAVSETDVRSALAGAPIAVLHGDTALFGAPRRFTTGALALMAPASGDGDEWYAVSAPVSPISPALAGLPWDSLAPISIGGVPTGDWVGLTVRRQRSQRDERALVAGSDRPRRVAVVAASGLWRWRFRGGVSADAYAALWGGVFDWLAAGGDDRRAAVPASAWNRAGESITWRRGARRDTTVIAVLRSNAGKRVDTVTLRFPGEAILAESQPLPMGEYDITVPGGTTRLFIAASREWLPRRAAVSSGAIGSPSTSGLAPRLRDMWWAYVLLLAAFSVEWFMRRRAGLR